MNFKPLYKVLAVTTLVSSFVALPTASFAELDGSKKVQDYTNMRASEVNLEQILKQIGHKPLHELIMQDFDLYKSYGEVWEKSGGTFYPLPVSSKLKEKPSTEYSPAPANYVKLNGINLIKMDVESPDLLANFKPLYFSVANFQNKTSTPQTYQTIEYAEEIKDVTTITKTKTLKTGVENSVKTELDVFGLAGMEYTAKLTVEGNWSNANTETHEYLRKMRIPPMSVLVQPGKGVRVKAEVFKGELENVDLKVDASVQGPYIINNKYVDDRGDIYGYLKTMQVVYPQKFKEITGGDVSFDDRLKITKFRGLGLLAASVTTSHYNVFLEEYDLDTGKVTKKIPVETRKLNI